MNTTGIIERVSLDRFCESFSESYKNNFSYEGKKALFKYLERLSEDIGEPIELDPIALCCEYAEYENAVSAYSDHNTGTLDIEGEDEEEMEAQALAWLEDWTQVIPVEGGGVIIQSF